MPDAGTCHETVDQATRRRVLEAHDHRCQVCGRMGRAAGGLATLHVHHQTRDPDDGDVHDPANLTVLCRRCHHWHHQQPTDRQLPVDLTDADQRELLGQDIEILRILAEQGPATTGDIVAELTGEFSAMTVRERLWVLMGLDTIVDERDRQIVDQDVTTGEWGLTGQITKSARGHIPDDPQILLQRAADERVRQALERGYDRDVVANVFDISKRTTFYKEKRAAAYAFPLEAFDGRGGRTSPTQQRADSPSQKDDGSQSTVEDEDQQRLDTLTDQDVATEIASRSGAETQIVHADTDQPEQLSQDSEIATEHLQSELQNAIIALQSVHDRL
ncbi:HNH endonuclease [Halapricum desulfuricans]|nr:HNH endonuclease signature motif containing protein [Halapricum desulfuricans]